MAAEIGPKGGEALHEDPNASVVLRLSALTGAATADLPSALNEIEGLYAGAMEAELGARAVVLASLGAQWIISEFANLAPLAVWSSRVELHSLDPLQLDNHAALIYSAGVLALRQFGSSR